MTNKIKFIQFKLDSKKAYSIEIILEESFRVFQNNVFFNTTPYQDATLDNIEDMSLDKDIFEFKVKNKLYKIDIRLPIIYKIAKFIFDLNNDQFVIDSNDEINITIDNDFFKITLKDVENNKWVSIDNSKYGYHFVERFPDPAKRYKIDSSEIIGSQILIKCVGNNL